MTIETLDLTIILVYLVGIVAIGIVVGYRKQTSSDQFFLAGRSLRWPVIGAALFTANISTIHLVGLAADGHRVGLVIGNYEWMASFCLILLGPKQAYSNFLAGPWRGDFFGAARFRQPRMA